MGSWSYLCRKHFIQEQPKLVKKKWLWAKADFDKGTTCDYWYDDWLEEKTKCKNKPFVEVYTPIKIRTLPKWLCNILNKIDPRYKDCECGWHPCGIKHFLWDCPKHGMGKMIKGIDDE